MSSIPLEETVDLDHLVEFSRMFRQKRIELGIISEYSSTHLLSSLGLKQCDIGDALGKQNRKNFSQATISRFEALNLTFRNMCKLKPHLEKLLEVICISHITIIIRNQ